MCRPCKSPSDQGLSESWGFSKKVLGMGETESGAGLALRSPRKGPRRKAFSGRAGLTLVEMLVATTLTLLLMAAAVQVFGLIGDSVNDSRATLEMNERLRAAVRRLQWDLEGLTVPLPIQPPVKIDENPGYFEYVEGPIGVPFQPHEVPLQPHEVAVDSTTGAPDTAVIDFDDILMFTSRSVDRPFVGKLKDTVVSSPVAEVAWFVRGGRLYRRVLLVLPAASFSGVTRQNFYLNNDVSARGTGSAIMANTLSDLTLRQNRYGHPTDTFPFDIRRWGCLELPTGLKLPTGLPPTLGETSTTTTGWLGYSPTTPASVKAPIDLLYNPQPQDGVLSGGTLGPRAYEDVILDHVVGFDVKAWDPSAPVYGRSGSQVAVGNYVDLGTFSYSSPDSRSKLTVTYDSWSTAYWSSIQADGFDSNGDGVVDDSNEVDVSNESVQAPPFRMPLRGIQVKIRVREPDSRQVREVTLIQDFVPK